MTLQGLYELCEEHIFGSIATILASNYIYW